MLSSQRRRCTCIGLRKKSTCLKLSSTLIRTIVGISQEMR
ncbi:hypothetical protein LINPERPRIM_LOCUS38049 [Linum perenne]